LIWAFATAAVEDANQPFDKNAYYYRPGHTAKLKTNYNILLTCRQAWLEAHALPMLQAEHSFWYHRAAPDARSKEWMANLTPLNRKHFGTLHLYAQMYAIEGLTCELDKLRNFFLPPHSPSRFTGEFQPSKFHVTIRHTDWWYWENDTPLRFEYRWFQAMLDSPDLRRTETVKLELETLDYKVSQLNPIVDHIHRLQSKEFNTHIVNGKPTTTKFVLTGEPEVASWTGPTNIDGDTYTPYKHKKELKYHVVTLTWKLHFPQYPKAYVPNLRLAPQVHCKRPTFAAPIQRPNIYRSDNLILDDDSAKELDKLVKEPRLRRWPFFERYSVRELHERRRLAHSMRPTASKTDDNMDDERDDILEWERGVQFRSSWEARIGEWYRRRQFWLCMKQRREDYWRGRFAAEKSLLRLEDRGAQ
jgi:hypothetical protein